MQSMQPIEKDEQTVTDKMQEFENRKSLFMRTVAHNLRSPLASMQSCLRVLTAGVPIDPADVNKLIGSAAARGEDMMNMLNDIMSLLEVSVEAEQPCEKVDVEKTAREAAAALAQKAADRRIELRMAIAPDSGTIQSRRKLLILLLKNLLENAIKYSDRDTFVLMEIKREADRLNVRVWDRGLVIGPEDMENVFVEFWRAGAAKAHDEHGTGLGLAIAKAAADACGGEVLVESAREIGTSFMGTIPIK